MTLDQSFDTLRRHCDQLLGRVSAQEQVVAEHRATVEALTSEVQVLTYTSAALQALLNAVSADSLASVEQLVTYGLRVVFEDPTLSFRLVVSTKRGAQSVEPRLVHGTVEAPILEAFGGGPATVVAFLLRLLTVRRLRLAPVLLLDEPFAMVSAEYVPNVGKLLRELADQTGMTFVVVTHQPSFLDYAHHAYEAVETSGGTIFKPTKGGVMPIALT